MTLLAIGINHNTATVDVREKVAFAPENMNDVLDAVCQLGQVEEAVILSTCNRSEIYCDVQQVADAKANIKSWLSNYHGLELEILEKSCYQLDGDSVVEHLSQVACGLDSLVLGEPQILGQLKSSYAVAKENGSLGPALNRLFPHAFTVAKQVRSQTAIGENPVSVAYAAVHMSTRIFTDLSQCTALLIGAGETIDLVAKHLKDKNIGNLIVANRTLTRAESLAKDFGAKAILLADIPDHLHEADIVISSTASQLPILGKGAVEQALKQRKRQPIFMVDIAVPRDIEAQVSQLTDVYLYTVDDLKDVIESNKKQRQQAADQALVIIREQLGRYQVQLKSLSAVSAIKGFRDHVEDIRAQEFEKAQAQLLAGNDPQKVLEQLSRRLSNKFMHEPSNQLKQASVDGDEQLHFALNQLFKINR